MVARLPRRESQEFHDLDKELLVLSGLLAQLFGQFVFSFQAQQMASYPRDDPHALAFASRGITPCRGRAPGCECGRAPMSVSSTGFRRIR